MLTNFMIYVAGLFFLMTLVVYLVQSRQMNHEELGIYLAIPTLIFLISLICVNRTTTLVGLSYPEMMLMSLSISRFSAIMIAVAGISFSSVVVMMILFITGQWEVR